MDERKTLELGCDILCVTRGGDGAALITKEDGAFIEHPGFAVDAVDTVGAGRAWQTTPVTSSSTC
jgi:fructokinase